MHAACCAALNLSVVGYASMHVICIYACNMAVVHARSSGMAHAIKLIMTDFEGYIPCRKGATVAFAILGSLMVKVDIHLCNMWLSVNVAHAV
jgi:hypothetical protein